MNSPLFERACPATDGRIKEGWVFGARRKRREQETEYEYEYEQEP